MQNCPIRTGCHTQRTIQHEFIHALGFYHEQSRPDRDQYVKINWRNIQDENIGQFIRQKTSLTFDVPYDGRSVMHYQSTAFNKARGLNSIESKVSNFQALFNILSCFFPNNGQHFFRHNYTMPKIIYL